MEYSHFSLHICDYWLISRAHFSISWRKMYFSHCASSGEDRPGDAKNDLQTSYVELTPVTSRKSVFEVQCIGICIFFIRYSSSLPQSKDMHMYCLEALIVITHI